MANLQLTIAHAMSRIDHIGQVVTLPALLEQRRAERAERLRVAEMARSTIAAGVAD